jgi:large conductance mechanosensitive channel
MARRGAERGGDVVFKGFKAFILRGNVVELAVAFIMGAAFGAVVKSLVDNVVTPLIGAIFKVPSFADKTVTIGKGVIKYGQFVNDLIAFLLIALAVYLFIVAPLNALAARRTRQEEPTTRPCPFCTSEIALTATRCPFCTSQVEAATPA